MNLTITRTCFLVCNNADDHVTFTKALLAVSPQTLCFTIPSGHDALHLMQEEAIIPQVIFIDLEMSEMNGLQFLRHIKGHEDYKSINVIVHATSATAEQIAEAKRLGAYAIYLRPYEYLNAVNMLSLCIGPGLPAFSLN
jgi:CheY-like chemotaxis protein